MRDVEQSVLSILQNLNSLDPLKDLFWSQLNYERVNQPLSRRGWPESVTHALAEDPLLFAGHEDFHVIYARLDSNSLPLGLERPLINRLLRDHPYALFVVSDRTQTHWHFINVRYHEEVKKRRVFRRITIRPHEHYRTAAERLAMLDLESISKTLHGLSPLAIQDRHDAAFDVEKIGKDFFLGYRDHFWSYVEAIRSSNKGKAHFMGDKGEENLHRFTQLLLGRILFLYFIQKKGWLNGDKAFVQNLFIPYQNSKGSGFYRDCLEPLFFNGLNIPGKKKDIGDKKYEIPYLNGGLFEPREAFFEGDPLKHPLIPDLSFQTFFDFLGAYNFTIAESTPLDQDVDIDPEMLGKVFENLLAAEDRHASGTYYTPRTIVEFMCRESLFHHLRSQTGIDRNAYDDLFEAPLEGRLPNIGKDLAREIQGRIRELKVLDPAVGSGAFLLGMLHELIQLWIITGRLLGESEAVQAGRLGDWKREMIGNSLFGVDNNPEACEIARLRLWLLMVVDESEPSPLPNLDYRIVEGDTLREKLDGEPILPPRSTVGFERENDLFRTEKPQGKLFIGERETRTAAIVQHLATYYQTHADAEKQHLRKSIEIDLKGILEEHWNAHEANWKRQRDQILEKALQMHKKPADLPRDWAGKLEEAGNHLERIRSEREALRRTGTWPVTPLRLFFAEAFAGNPGGFDIIIANPPYVRQELIRPLKPLLQEEFGGFFTSTADLYTYFYARGLDLLRPGGILCFIAPNKFMRAGYGKNTRRLLTSDATPRLILDFGDLPIFEATTYPAILLIEKKSAAEGDQATAVVFNDPKQIEEISDTVSEIGFPMPIKSLSEEGWTLDRLEVLKLMAKLREKGVPLGEYVNGRFYRGILTGLNKAFVIDEVTRKRLIQEDPKSEEIIKPWLQGRDIKKWCAEWAGLYVIAIASSANKRWLWSDTKNAEKIFTQTYPAIYAHLSHYKDPLMERDDQGEFWWELRSCAYYAEFEKPKILWGNLATSPKFAMEQKPYYVSAPANLIPSADPYLLGLLNSSICSWLISFLAAVRGGNFLEFKPMYVGQVPVFLATDKQKAPIIKRVEVILKDPAGPDVPRLEKEIDELVFELYGLTAKEIEILKPWRQG